VVALQVGVAPASGAGEGVTGWSITVEATVEGPCPALSLPAWPRPTGSAPPSVQGEAWTPTELGGVRHARWGDERRQPGAPGAGDVLRLPELEGRGRATFTWTTTAPELGAPLSFEALPVAADVAPVLRLARGALDALHPEASGSRRGWAAAAGVPLQIDPRPAWREPGEGPAAPVEGGDVTPLGAPDDLALTIAAPTRIDVRRALADGAVQLDVSATWRLPPGSGVAEIALPPDVAPRVLIDDRPAPGALGVGRLRVALDPAAERALSVRWTAPITDAWGPLPWTDADHLTLAAGTADAGFAPGAARVDGDGELVVDGVHWRLARLGDVPLLTDAARFLTELDRRSTAASYPEPAIPQRWRAWPLDEAVPSLTTLLHGRVAVLDAPALRWLPRPLMRAQASGAMTPLEAAVTLVRLASQLRVPAQLVLLDPNPSGGAVPSPGTRPVAVARIGELTWWMDPQCPSCGGGELPAEMDDWAVFGAP
jgi:hypothetical protein